jgi:xylulokinase
LNTVGIKEKQLSKLYKPATITGKVNKEFNQLEGLKAGIPVTAGSLDHHIAALGAGAGTIADVSESTGTVLACLSLTDKFKPEPEIITGKGISDTFWKLAFDNNGAGNLDWYVKNYASGFSFEDLTKQAAKIPAGSEGLVALPCSSEYEGLEGFVNKKSFHTEAHYFRALLESSAYTLKQLIEKLYPENTPDKVVATGGGSKNDLWLQIKADMLKAEFIVTNCVEPACRGAAMFAAKGCGWYENIQKVSENWIKVNKTFRPDHKVQEEYNHWFKELDKT